MNRSVLLSFHIHNAYKKEEMTHRRNVCINIHLMWIRGFFLLHLLQSGGVKLAQYQSWMCFTWWRILCILIGIYIWRIPKNSFCTNPLSKFLLHRRWCLLYWCILSHSIGSFLFQTDSALDVRMEKILNHFTTTYVHSLYINDTKCRCTLSIFTVL